MTAISQDNLPNYFRNLKTSLLILVISLPILLLTAYCNTWAASGDSDYALLQSQLKEERINYSRLQNSIVGMANPPSCARRAIRESSDRVASLERKIAAIEKSGAWRQEQREETQKLYAPHQGKTFKTKKHWWEI